MFLQPALGLPEGQTSLCVCLPPELRPPSLGILLAIPWPEKHLVSLWLFLSRSFCLSLCLCASGLVSFSRSLSPSLSVALSFPVSICSPPFPISAF